MREDYVILFDEYQEPYLAHSSGAWKEHKYKMKIPNALGNGKDLYLYTDAEIRAWQEHGRRTLGNRIKDFLGWDERDARNDAARVQSHWQQQMRKMNSKTAGNPYATSHDKDVWLRTSRHYNRANSAYEESESKYRKTLLGRLESFGQKLRNLVSRISGTRKGEQIIDEHADVPLSEVRREQKHDPDTSAHALAEKDYAEQQRRAAAESAAKAKPHDNVKTEADMIADIRKIAANADRSLTAQQRQELGKQYGLTEQDLNIIDGNLRHPQMQGPTGQAWIDDFIRKNAKLGQNQNGSTPAPGSTVAGTNSAGGKSSGSGSESRVGNTDFYAYKRSDGSTVIREEDMQWTLPPGVSINSPGIMQVLNSYSTKAGSQQAVGKNQYTAKEWQSGVTDDLNAAISKLLQQQNTNGR